MTPEEAVALLAQFREEIDAIDRELVEVLNRRTRVVEEIGRVKQSVNFPVYEPKREQDVFRNITAANRGPLSADAAQRIFERIIEEMRTLQRIKITGEPPR